MDANQIEGRHGHLWSKRQTEDTDSNPTMMNANIIKSILLLPDEHSTSARSLPSACLRYTRRRNKLDANSKQTTPTATPTSTATCQRMSTTETTGRVRRLAKVLLMAFLVCMIGSDSNSNNNNQLKSPSFAALAAQVNSNNDNNGGHLATGGSSNGAHSLFDNQASDLATSAGDHRQQLSLLAKSQLPEAHDQNTRGAQQQQQQQVACSGACGGPARRGKRHLAPGATSDTELDCHKLSTFWLFLRANYPSLARHLFEWSSSPGGQSDEQFLWARSGQVGRTVARLLDEAERLIGGGDVRPVGAAGGSRGANSWLSRVSSNPAYAKLIQQIQKSKLQQQQQQQQHQTSSLRPNYLAPQAHNEQSQQHFGKVVNYPHEVVANAPDNSYGMTRTLNKLRILSDHNRQLNEQENGKQNEQENEQIMSNKIPTINYQDMEANVDLRKSLELADNARNKFVYGNVILRPKQQTTNDEQTKPKKPIDSLRDYFSQEQKQQQQQQNYHNHKHHQVAEDLSGGRRTDDELMSQQRSQQVASEEDDNLDEPFPGVVLSSPVKHPEVRQLRSDFGTSTSSDLNGDNIRPLD